MPARWYVLSTKPHKERAVCRLLESRDLEVYFPALRVKPVNPRSSKIRPYFPGYLFVQLDLDALGDDAVRWTPGANGLVRFGDQPAAVPDQFVRELQQHLATLQETRARWPDGLQQGDRVRIVRGPFAGYEAIFDTRLSGSDRVQVFLSFLSHTAHRAKLDASDIERID